MRFIEWQWHNLNESLSAFGLDWSMGSAWRQAFSLAHDRCLTSNTKHQKQATVSSSLSNARVAYSNTMATGVKDTRRFNVLSNTPKHRANPSPRSFTHVNLNKRFVASRRLQDHSRFKSIKKRTKLCRNSPKQSLLSNNVLFSNEISTKVAAHHVEGWDEIFEYASWTRKPSPWKLIGRILMRFRTSHRERLCTFILLATFPRHFEGHIVLALSCTNVTSRIRAHLATFVFLRLVFKLMLSFNGPGGA